MNNSKILWPKATIAIGILCLCMARTGGAAGSWITTTVEQPQHNRWTGDMFITAEIKEPFGQSVRIKDGSINTKFWLQSNGKPIADGTKVSIVACSFSANNAIASNGTPEIINTSVRHYTLRIPIKATHASTNSWARARCRIAYDVTNKSDTPPTITMQGAQFVRDDGVTPYHILSYAGITINGYAMGGTKISSIGSLGGNTNISGKTAPSGQLTNATRTTALQGGTLTVQHLDTIALNPTNRAVVAVKVQGSGEASAVWESGRGNSTELALTRNGKVWAQGQEISLGAGHNVTIELKPAALNTWGKREETITINWNIK